MLSPGELTPQKRGFRPGSPLSGVSWKTSPDLRPRGESQLSDGSLGVGSVIVSHLGNDISLLQQIDSSLVNNCSTKEIDFDTNKLPDAFPLFRTISHPTQELNPWLESVLQVTSTSFDNVFSQPHHIALQQQQQPLKTSSRLNSWRGRSQVETRAVILMICLNCGTDPPDKSKVDSGPRLLCWTNPTSYGSGQRAAQEITMLLRNQYLRCISDKLHFMKFPDAPYEDLPAMKEVRGRGGGRVVFHYNGFGVPAPADKGELWVFNKKYTEYVPVRPPELLNWVGLPAVFILDVRRAGHILDGLLKEISNNGLNIDDFIALLPCGSMSDLPSNPNFPADILTSALTTPIQLVIKWHCYQSNRTDDKFITMSILRNSQLRDNLYSMYSVIVDCIAYEVMPPNVYFGLFKDDPTLAALFRNFLLAKRVLQCFNVQPVSYPSLPETNSHRLWDTLDLYIDTAIAKIFRNSIRELSATSTGIYKDMLTSFTLWVRTINSSDSNPPPNLKFILNSLYLPALGEQALYVIALYIDLGRSAANTLLVAGLPRCLIHLTNGSLRPSMKPVLLYIWMKLASLEDDLLLSELTPLVRFFVDIVEGVDVAISSPEQNFYGWGSDTNIKLMSTTVIIFMCGHSADTRCAVASRLLPKFESLLSPLYGSSPDVNGGQGKASLLVSLLVLLTMMAEADMSFQIDLLSGGSHQWITECMSSKVSCVRAAAVGFIGSLLPRSTDLEDSRPLSSIDTHFMKILLDSACDLSVWVRLTTARTISIFITTLQNYPSIGSSSDGSNDEHVLLPLATNVVHILQADPMEMVASVADSAASQLSVTRTSSHRPSNTPPSLRGLSGLSGGLGSLENKKAILLCKSDLSSMTDDIVETGGNLSGCPSIGTSPVVEPLEGPHHVTHNSKIFSASVAHVNDCGLECSNSNDISQSNNYSKLFYTSQTKRITVRCLEECSKVAHHQSTKGSIVSEFDAGGSCIATFHPTARIAISSSKDVTQVWDWEESKLLNTLNYSNCSRIRDAITHSSILTRYPNAPLLASTSGGFVFFIQSPTFDCVVRISSRAPEIWGSGVAGVVKVADILTEQSFNDIKLQKDAILRSICPPNEYSSPAVAWCGLTSGTIIGVDKREGSETLALGRHNGESSVTAVSYGNHFYDDDHTVSSLSDNGSFMVWDTRKEGNCLLSADLCKKGKLKCTEIHPVAPLVMTGSSTSLRVHNPLEGRMSSLSTDRESTSSLFRSKMSPVVSAAFHPFLPLTISSHSDGRVLISAF